MSDALDPQILEVSWGDLLDAHQASVLAGDDYRPCLRLDTGEVVNAALLDAEEFAKLGAAAQILAVPTKSIPRCLEQRRRFAATLCDRNLRARIAVALEEPNPFVGFDAALETVPVEAERWREEERHEDLRTLENWLIQAGVFPEPRPSLTRTIIEFPLHRRRD